MLLTIQQKAVNNPHETSKGRDLQKKKIAILHWKSRFQSPKEKYYFTCLSHLLCLRISTIMEVKKYLHR